MGDDVAHVQPSVRRQHRSAPASRGDVGRAVVAAPQVLLAEQVERRQRHLDALGGNPTTTAEPPGRIMSQAWRIVSGRPTTSNAWSTPPGTSSRTRATASDRRPVDRVGGAAARGPLQLFGGAVDRDHATRPPPAWRPRSPAGRRRRSRSRPRSRPTRTRAVLRTAPSPVTTPQPSSAACHSGSAAGSGIALAAGHDAALGEAGHAGSAAPVAPSGEGQPRGAVQERAAPGVVGRGRAEVESAPPGRPRRRGTTARSRTRPGRPAPRG